ncbi:hypothetical protein HHI36_020680 [Cryptolaemus montrouzieri]|uniref:Uncharacterized protein n=1 Tax=Cryptolaemus montrouzieri TaxID=559131 RepID=A0ABD2NB25_9CUCU
MVLILFFRKPRDGKIIIHLEDDERIHYPKSSHATIVKVHHAGPVVDEKFYYGLSKINKKPNKYPKNGKLKSTLDFETLKSCCDVQEVVPGGLEELFRPVSIAALENYGITESKSENVKPVTEIIEDDIKYDFRTKTHSL